MDLELKYSRTKKSEQSNIEERINYLHTVKPIYPYYLDAILQMIGNDMTVFEIPTRLRHQQINQRTGSNARLRKLRTSVCSPHFHQNLRKIHCMVFVVKQALICYTCANREFCLATKHASTVACIRQYVRSTRTIFQFKKQR